MPEYPGQSSELAPPTPSTASECVPPGSKWGVGHTLACGKGAGGANSDEGTQCYSVYYPLSLTQTVAAQRKHSLQNNIWIEYDPHGPTRPHPPPTTLMGTYLQK